MLFDLCIVFRYKSFPLPISRGLIKKLDVVTAGLKTSPIQKFCTREKIDMFLWPLSVPVGVYDVGTVVSFGHLLPAAVINSFPM